MHRFDILDYSNEIKRKKIHLLSFLIPLFYIFFPNYIIPYISLLVIITLSVDLCRLLYPESKYNYIFNTYLNHVSRKYEKNNLLSATILILISAIIILLFDRTTSIIAISLASISDSFAAIIGLKYGEIKTVNNKTVEGFLGFFLSSLLVIAILKIFIDLNIDIIILILICFITSIIETLTPTKYDNITIPVSAALLIKLFSILVI